MEFLVLLTASATPEDLFLPSPVPVQAFAGSLVHAPPPAPARNLVVCSVVPDSSERKNTVIGSLGRVTPGFSLAIAGSSQVLTVPLKILARSSASTVSLSTPSTL